MHYFIRRPWDLPIRRHTPESIYQERGWHRREFLQSLGLAGLVLVTGCQGPSDEELKDAGEVTPAAKLPAIYPANRNETFSYGRPETIQRETEIYANFYEFSGRKDCWRHVKKFRPDPWSVEITGLCRKPRTFDLDDFYRELKFEERHYRHRCVETWAMCVPWTGFPLRDLLASVDPLPRAKYVKFTTFERPTEAPRQSDNDYPWPYTEGLTLAEAMNDLAFIATGVYGHPLPKQNGAPIRLVVPWKYGFKSCKSLVKIELASTQPATFWNTVSPDEYQFRANVDPNVPHPRWSQRTERMLGTGERYQTQKYNGYGEFVAGMYQ